MRAYVLYDPPGRLGAYDGTRLRKSVKAALALTGVDLAESTADLPDVVHVLSPIHEKAARDYGALGYKIVSSALYAESDPRARYLDYGPEGDYALSARAKVLLEASSAVFVPSAHAEKIVKDAMPGKKIIVLPPPVDLDRYGNPSEATKAAFVHYFMARLNRQHAIVRGDYDDEEGLEALSEAASLLPDLDFYFFGLADSPSRTRGKKSRLNVKTPENLRFCDPRSDDLYLGGLATSAFYLSLSYRHEDPIGTYEAFAAGTQVFRLGPAREGSILGKDGLFYGCLTPEELSIKAALYRNGGLEPTVDAAKKAASLASLRQVGEAIKGVYSYI